MRRLPNVKSSVSCFYIRGKSSGLLWDDVAGEFATDTTLADSLIDGVEDTVTGETIIEIPDGIESGYYEVTVFKIASGSVTSATSPNYHVEIRVGSGGVCDIL